MSNINWLNSTFFLGVFAISSILTVQAQSKLVGTSTLGGGSIFSVDSDGDNPEKWVDLSDGSSPFYTQLIESNGKLKYA